MLLKMKGGKIMSKANFYKCETCGNLVGVIHSSGIPLVCCGKNMNKIEANSTDAAGEKHVPSVKVNGKTITVDVGEVPHPMTEEHLIEWVYLETTNGGQRKNLLAGAVPVITFELVDEKPVAAYAYCNLHGLWKIDID